MAGPAQAPASPLSREIYREGEFPRAAQIQIIHDQLRGMRGADGVTVEPYRDGIVIRGNAATDLANFAFGWAGRGESAGNAVKINGGPIQRSNDLIWAEDTEVLVGGDADDHHIIYVENGGVALYSAQKSSFTGHDETTYRVPLYEVYLKNGSPILHRVLWSGIDLRTWFSAPS